MIKESVTNFLELLRLDEQLAKRLPPLTADNLSEFSILSSKLGHERGLNFEPADIQDALTENQADLTDEQLEAIAGGIWRKLPPE